MNLYEASLTLARGGMYVFHNGAEFWTVERVGQFGTTYRAHPFNPKRATAIQIIGTLQHINEEVSRLA